jgi:hypothetical protein
MWKVLLGAIIGAILTAAAATAASRLHLLVLRPGDSLYVKNYGYPCASTVRTPNWSCWYGSPDGASGTPILTVAPFERLMTVQSLVRPRVEMRGGEYWTTFPR